MFNGLGDVGDPYDSGERLYPSYGSDPKRHTNHVLLGLEVFLGSLGFTIGRLFFARTDYAFNKLKGRALIGYFAVGYALLIGGSLLLLTGFASLILG